MRLSKTEGIYKAILSDKRYQDAILIHRDFSIKKKKGKVIIEASEVTISPEKVDVRA